MCRLSFDSVLQASGKIHDEAKVYDVFRGHKVVGELFRSSIVYSCKEAKRESKSDVVWNFIPKISKYEEMEFHTLKEADAQLTALFALKKSANKGWFSSLVNKEAWKIRKSAAKRLMCGVMKVVWGYCYRQAKRVIDKKKESGIDFKKKKHFTFESSVNLTPNLDSIPNIQIYQPSFAPPLTNPIKTVRFPKDIFSKSLKDYYDWKTAWIREAVQNSVDAGAKEIRIEIDEQNSIVSCLDDGCGMNRDIVEDVLLVLGESYKEGENNVGGFGRAKEILFFAHESWKVETRTSKGQFYAVDGNYIDYSQTENGVSQINSKSGTYIEAKVSDIKSFLSQARCFLEKCQTNGCKIYLNGEKIKGFRRASKLGQLSFGTVYSNATDSFWHGYLYVRKNGVVMFRRWVGDGLNKALIIELEGDSTEILTTNRDGLISQYQREFDDFIVDEVESKYDAKTKDERPMTFKFVGLPLASATNSSEVSVSNTILNNSESQYKIEFLETPMGNIPNYGVPFVFFVPENDDFDYTQKKVGQLASVWQDLGNLIANDLLSNKVFGEKVKDLTFVFGFNQLEDGYAAFNMIGNYAVITVNPKIFSKMPLREACTRFIDNIIHEIAHIFVENHSTDFIACMNSLKDALGVYKYYEYVLNWIQRGIEPLGIKVETEVEVKEEKQVEIPEKGLYEIEKSKKESFIFFDGLQVGRVKKGFKDKWFYLMSGENPDDLSQEIRSDSNFNSKSIAVIKLVKDSRKKCLDNGKLKTENGYTVIGHRRKEEIRKGQYVRLKWTGSVRVSQCLNGEYVKVIGHDRFNLLVDTLQYGVIKIRPTLDCHSESANPLEVTVFEKG